MTRVEIDLNVRSGVDETYAGYEDVHGDFPNIGDWVEVFEAESGLAGFGQVLELRAETRIIVLGVQFAKLARPLPWGAQVTLTTTNVLPADAQAEVAHLRGLGRESNGWREMRRQRDEAREALAEARRLMAVDFDRARTAEDKAIALRAAVESLCDEWEAGPWSWFRDAAKRLRRAITGEA